MAIAERYAALERPTEGDDAAFAAELGLSVDSLLRLVAAWRRGTDAEDLRTTYRNPPEEVRLAALEATRNPDMSGVDRRRRARTARRIAAIRRYLSIAAPTVADLRATAAELGIGVAGMDRLLAAWIVHRRADAIPGAVPARRLWRKNQTARRRSHEVLREAHAELGADAPIASVHRRAVEMSVARGVRPLGVSRTYDVVRALRSTGRSEREP